MIEIIVYRKECDWCYWWQDTASDDHRSCCFNGSVSDENKKQLDPFSMLIGFGYDLWRGGWNGTAFLFQVQEFHWWFSDGCFISECLVREISNFFVYWEELWDQYIFCGVSGMHF